MALVAEIFAFLVPHMAVGAVQLILVMRGEVRIRGLHVLRLRHQCLHVVAGPLATCLSAKAAASAVVTAAKHAKTAMRVCFMVGFRIR